MKCNCEQECIHEKDMIFVKENMLEDDFVLELAEFFKVFGDSTRMKIISALLLKDLCVCELASISGSSISATSHQLRILKQAKLVKYEKVGKNVTYTIADEHIREIFMKGREHIEEIYVSH